MVKEVVMDDVLKIKRFNIETLDDVYELMQNIAAEGEWYVENKVDIKETFHRLKTGLEEKLPQLIACNNDEIVGWAEAYNAGRTNLCLNICVAKEFRSQGVGSALAINIIKFAELSGFKKLSLNVFDYNDAALRIAMKNGFKVKAYTNKRNCNGRDIVRSLTMFKEIASGNK